MPPVNFTGLFQQLGQFKAPGFVQPRSFDELRGVGNVGQSLDSFFNVLSKAKGAKVEGQILTARAQLAQAQAQQAQLGVQQTQLGLAGQGVMPSGINPDDPDGIIARGMQLFGQKQVAQGRAAESAGLGSDLIRQQIRKTGAEATALESFGGVKGSVRGKDLNKALGTKIFDDDEIVAPQIARATQARVTKEGALGLSEAEKAIDKQFAKDYNTFIAGGGFADAQKNINQLKEVRAELSRGANVTGPVVGRLPFRDVFNPRAEAIQETVEEVVQRNLRLVLGAQFTEKEGERLISRAYNPKQPEAENIKRLDRLISQIDQAAQAKVRAGEYFEKNGTLKGFRGTQFTSPDQFLRGNSDTGKSMQDQAKELLRQRRGR